MAGGTLAVTIAAVRATPRHLGLHDHLRLTAEATGLRARTRRDRLLHDLGPDA
ncbi:MAG: hypothetical protein M0007_14315 [Actinomycetota bacterium]|nr:hypothetical protein [Actinomycetota bacterium]